MANYTFRCPKCGDHRDVSRPMADRDDPVTCTYCETTPMDRIYSGAFQFTYGRKTFHDGAEGTGETLRETESRWVEAARAQGIEPERYHG